MRSLLLLLVFSFISITGSFGQTSETVVSDRPGQAISPNTVGKGIFQIQTGLNHSAQNSESLDITSFAHGTLIQFGLVERLELSLAASWGFDKSKADDEVVKTSGLKSTSVALRYNILSGENGPSLGIQTGFSLPIASDNYKVDGVTIAPTISSGISICENFGLTANLGLLYYSQESDLLFTYVLNAGFSASETLAFFAEFYGFLDEFDLDFDAGVAYLLSDDFLLDFSFGLTEFSDFFGWFIDAGATFRF